MRRPYETPSLKPRGARTEISLVEVLQTCCECEPGETYGLSLEWLSDRIESRRRIDRIEAT